MLVREFDLEIDGSGSYEENFQIEAASRGGSILVVVEALTPKHKFEAAFSIERQASELGGVGGAAEQAAPGGLMAQELQLERNVEAEMRVFAGGLSAQEERLSLSILAPAGSRFRVFVGWVKEAAGWLGCEACKLAVRAVLKALAAKLGHIVHDAINLPAHLLDHLSPGSVKPILDFLQDLLGDDAWKHIEAIWRAMGLVNRLIREVAEKVCQLLRICP